VLLCAGYLVIFCVSLFANTLVCHVVRRHRRLHNVTNVFIANLAVSDIFITLVNIPYNVARHLAADLALGRATCALANLALTAFVYVSTFTMTAIAVDRYVVILHPLRPRMSVTVGLLVVAVTWIVAVLMSLPFAVFARVIDQRNLRTLAHNRCKWHNADKRHAVGEDASAHENCICVKCEQTIHTNINLKFLTTKTSQKTQVYICSCICTWHNVLACFVFAIWK